MSLTTLNDKMIVGVGNARICYLYPEDNKKVIKVENNNKFSRHQNQLEEIYYKYLEKRKVSFEHITRCYGWADFGDKRGLIFDRVFNVDGSEVLSLADVIKEQKITLSTIEQLLEELRLYLEKNIIVFVDVSLNNIMCQKIDDSRHKLVIIDVLG